LGVIPIPFSGEVSITQTEARMLDQLTVSKGLFGISRFKDIRDQAFEVSTAHYPTPTPLPADAPTSGTQTWLQNDGHRDAFRHAYWNALMTRQNGEEWARQFATAHEGVPGDYAVREAMDLYNNEVGRRIASHNPGATEEQIAALIQQAVDNGD